VSTSGFGDATEQKHARQLRIGVFASQLPDGAETEPASIGGCGKTTRPGLWQSARYGLLRSRFPCNSHCSWRGAAIAFYRPSLDLSTTWRKGKGQSSALAISGVNYGNGYPHDPKKRAAGGI
jgi:hypothetical protein